MKSTSYHSVNIIHSILEILWQKLAIDLQLRQFVLKTTPKSIKYINQIINIIFQINSIPSPQTPQNIHDNQQTPSIRVDLNMPFSIPSSIKIDKQIKKKKKINKQQQEQTNVVQQKKKKKFLKWNQTECIPLAKNNLIQEDRIIKFLREVKLQQINNQEIVINKKKYHNRSKDMIDRAFDYNGKLIKTKQPKHINLLSQNLQLKLKHQQKLVIINKNYLKQAQNNVPQETISISHHYQTQPHPSNPSLPTNQITENSKNQTIYQNQIIDYEIPLGDPSDKVKFITTQKSQSPVKRNLSLPELKLNMKQSKLTRKDYLKLKKLQMGIQNQKTETQSRKDNIFKTIESTMPTLPDQVISKRYKSVQYKKDYLVKVENQKLKDRYLLQSGVDYYQNQEEKPLQKTLNKSYRSSSQNLTISKNNDTHLDFLLGQSVVTKIENKPHILPRIKRDNSDLTFKVRQRLNHDKKILLQIRKKFNFNWQRV